MKKNNKIKREYNKKAKKIKQKILFGLIYPNKKSIGSSSYSIRLLYHLLNSFPFVQCERIFLPDHVTFPASRDFSPLKQLNSQEHSIFPLEFDILGFSVHYENDFRNILWFLDKLQIPLEWQKRRELKQKTGKNYPLLIAGGPVITSNPLPLSEIIEMFFIGDVEPLLEDFLTLFSEFLEHDDYELLIKQIFQLKGIYLPKLNNRIQRQVLNDLNLSNVPINQLITDVESQNNVNSIFSDKFLLEINRGCPFQCKFCISSFHNQPFRNRSFEQIKEIIDIIKYNETKKVGLIGSCVTAHPHFYEFCQYILESGMKFSIPSIRLEYLNEKMIRLFEKANIKTITIAPEAGSEKLRFNLGKRIEDQQIIAACEKIKNSQIRNIKFYFLMGLPQENDSDIENIVKLIKKIDLLKFPRKALRVNVNPFIPKLNTPFEYHTENFLSKNLNIFKHRYQILENGLKNIDSVKIKFRKIKNLIKEARIQTLFSVGDEEVSELLIKYYQNGANFGSLRRVLKESHFSLDNYLLRIQNGYSPWKFQ